MTRFSVSRPRLALITGLILFVYIATHLINHALGLISLPTAENWLFVFVTVWHSPFGTLALYGAAVTHISLALLSIFRRRTLRLPVVEWVRMALGFWMPTLLIGHFAATRLEAEFAGASSTYGRVIASIWTSNSDWRQLGLLAPGWAHGCMGLNIAFRHLAIWKRLKPLLFSIALLIPILSALGFIEMGRQIGASSLTVVQNPTTSGTWSVERRVAIARWRDGLIVGYFGLICLAFAARIPRGLVERLRYGTVEIRYPAQTARVPLGWSILDTSRSLGFRHAARCGGKGRCSTCRVLITAGFESCSPPSDREQITLHRIQAGPNVRLACQLRPTGDVSVLPLVAPDDAERASNSAAELQVEQAIVMLYCDFLNKNSLSGRHLSQDLMFVFARYAEAISAIVRSYSGQISFVGHNSICALFGVHSETSFAAKNALMTAIGIESALEELHVSIARPLGIEMRVGISIDANVSALAAIRSEKPNVIALGPIYDGIDELRRAVKDLDANIVVGKRVFLTANVATPNQHRVGDLGSPYYVASGELLAAATAVFSKNRSNTSWQFGSAIRALLRPRK